MRSTHKTTKTDDYEIQKGHSIFVVVAVYCCDQLLRLVYNTSYWSMLITVYWEGLNQRLAPTDEDACFTFCIFINQNYIDIIIKTLWDLMALTVTRDQNVPTYVYFLSSASTANKLKAHGTIALRDFYLPNQIQLVWHFCVYSHTHTYIKTHIHTYTNTQYIRHKHIVWY